MFQIHMVGDMAGMKTGFVTERPHSRRMQSR